MAISQLYPNQRPTLNLNFARSKTLDPRITFTRNSTATYVGSDGLIKTAAAGEARFDHDPVTGDCLGLLIEQSRTNLIPESTNLNNTTYWHTSTNPGSLNQSANAGWMVATANTTEVVSPDGTNNACKLSGLTTTTFDKNYKVHVVPNSSNVSMSQNVVYTWTLFVKDPDSVLDSDNQLAFMYGSKFSNTNAQVRFDLSNDTYTFHGDINNESASITPYPNGWKKLTATFTNTSSGGGPRYFLQELSPQTGTVNGYSATQFSINGEKFYVWGFQIEQGSFGTSYMPTSGSTFQRLDDEAEITGTNFSSWYSPDENTVLWEASTNDGSTGSKPIYVILDSTQGTSVNSTVEGARQAYYVNNDYIQIVARTPENTRRMFSTASEYKPLGKMNKTAHAYSGDSDVGAAINGVDPSYNAGASSNPGTVDTMWIGYNANFIPYLHLNGHISRFAYYNTRLSNTALEALTK